MFNRKVYNGEEYPLVMTMNLSIIARVLLGSRDIFVQVKKISIDYNFVLRAYSVMKSINEEYYCR